MSVLKISDFKINKLNEVGKLVVVEKPKLRAQKFHGFMEQMQSYSRWQNH